LLRRRRRRPGSSGSSSSIGAWSHRRIRDSTERSETHISTHRISLSWGIVSKYDCKSASYTSWRPERTCARTAAKASSDGRRSDEAGQCPWSESDRNAAGPGADLHSFVACCPSQPRRARSLLTSTLRDPHGLHPLRRAGHSHLRVSRPFGSLALRPVNSPLRGFGVALLPDTTRAATRVVDRSHGLLLSSSLRAWSCLSHRRARRRRVEQMAVGQRSP
jgi:hypothetical protein